MRGVNDPGWVTCNGSKDNTLFFYGAGGSPVDGDTTNEVDLDGTQRAARWQASLSTGHEIWLKGLWRTPWEPHTIKVDAINLDDTSIRLAEQPPSGISSKYTRVASESPLWRVGSGKEHWFALNLLDEIDQPGEWAIDFADRKIYYYPIAPIETLNIMISDRDMPVVRLQQASFITLAGLACCRWHGAWSRIQQHSRLPYRRMHHLQCGRERRAPGARDAEHHPKQ